MKFLVICTALFLTACNSTDASIARPVSVKVAFCEKSAELADRIAVNRDRGVSRTQILEAIQETPVNADTKTVWYEITDAIFDRTDLTPDQIKDAMFQGCSEAFTN